MSDNEQQGSGIGDVSIVVLSGRLGVKVEQDLAGILLKQIDAAQGPVLLDMSSVDFVSSSGLRSLMMAYKHAAATNKKIAMAHVAPGVYKIFKLTASVEAFHVFDDKETASTWLKS